MGKILVVTHYTEIPGTSHHLMRYLKQKGIDATFLLLPLDKWKNLTYKIIRISENKEMELEKKYPNTYFTDVFFIIPNTLKNWELYIGVDPLNALVGGILKKILNKKWTVIFYSVDYSPDRFSNRLINTIYSFIDRVAVKYSDYIWCTSRRMIYARAKQVSDLSKIIYVPNGTWNNYRRLKKKSNNDNINLVFVGYIGKQFDLYLFISEVNKRERIKLHIIGDGPMREYLEAVANKENVKFYGKYPHDQVLRILTEKKLIGIAPYNKKVSHVLYGSPLKIIEYLSCGLPVITSDVVEIAKDIKRYKCGFVYSTPEQLKKILDKIEYSRFKYNKLSKNAIKLAKKFYWTHIYDRAFERVLNQDTINR